jgi:TolB-like protein/DNA-binding winged helix-turn-helix (wHTH) protein
MKAAEPYSRTTRFGDFEVDLRAGELHKHGVRIRLQEQPLKILTTLVERAGDVVLREEFRQALWPADTFVDFDHGLSAAVNKLREALCDSADHPRYVETIPRRGYRFIAEVDGFVPPATRVEPQSQPAPSPRAKVLLWPALLVGTGLLGVAAVLVGLNVGGWRERLLPRPGNVRVQSIAVLPLANLSGDPSQEFFADGMTEELVTQLGKVSALRVISHTSVNRFKATKMPLQQIARELNVDAVVEGTVAREGNRVRVTTNLIQANPEKHLWAESYDRDLRNVLDLQSEIARTVADQIKITVTPAERLRLNVVQPLDPEAHELLLKGYFYFEKWNEAGFKKAAEYFTQSAQKEPQNARAYAGLAIAYAGIGISDPSAYSKEEAAALQALKIDDNLGEAHNALRLGKIHTRLGYGGRRARISPRYRTQSQ